MSFLRITTTVIAAGFAAAIYIRVLRIKAASPALPVRLTQVAPARAPADPTSRRLVGSIIGVRPEGLLVRCPEPPPPIASSLARVGGGGGVGPGDLVIPNGVPRVFGFFLLRGHPEEGLVADGDAIDCDAYAEGVYQHGLRGFEKATVHRYRFIRNNDREFTRGR